ncbi:TPA: hypothetical protein JRX92_003528 [Elizabethkingia anophelis]|nr:hypothetical protein [Elizabethkingia anophelis]
MFVLRRVTGDGVEMNKVLGEGYNYVCRERNYDEFCKMFEKYFEKNHVADLDTESDNDTKNCYAFITSDGHLQPLYKTQHNYIMTERGKTFDNVSYR